MNISDITNATNSASLSSLVQKNSFFQGNTVASEQNSKARSFESYILDAVNAVNEKQLDVNRVEQKLITDPESVDIHDVTTAMAKAQMSLSLAQTVIDRLLTGWSELQTTR